MGRPPGGQYDEETVERCLTALALHQGMPKRAVEELEGWGLERVPSASALKAWRYGEHRERYHRIAKRVQGEVADVIAAELETLIAREHELAHDLIDRLADNLHLIPAKDLPGALRNVETSKAINVDKWAAIRGRPMVHVQHHSADQILERLARIDPTLVVDSDAEEITEPAQLEQETAKP